MSPDTVVLKLQWAEKRFSDLWRILDKFGRRACPFVIERDPNTREILYKLAFDPAIDDEIPLIAGEVLQHLRSALDYLAWALVVANHEKPSSKTCFPIISHAPTAPEYEPVFARAVKGMHKDAVDLIRQIKPHEGGNQVLVALHELNRREKHRLLITVGAYMHNWSISQHIDATNPSLERLEVMGRAYASSETWNEIRKSCPLKAGDVLLADWPDAKPNKDAKFTIQVALNESGIVEAEPLIAILSSCVRIVGAVVGSFKGMY